MHNFQCRNVRGIVALIIEPIPCHCSTRTSPIYEALNRHIAGPEQKQTLYYSITRAAMFDQCGVLVGYLPLAFLKY